MNLRLVLDLLRHQDADVVGMAKSLARQLDLTLDERRELDATP